MKLIAIVALLVATTSAALQGYKLPNPTRPGLQSGDKQSATVGHTSTTLAQTSAGHTSNSAHSSGQSISVHSTGRPHSTVASGAAHTSSGSAVSGTDGFTETGISSGSGASLAAGGSAVSTTIGFSREQGNFETPCKDGEVRHIDGSCIVPEITRKVFVVSVPRQAPRPSDSLPDIPPPRVDHNILFVRLPEGGVGPDPIVVPPPRQDNIVYVLSKNSQNGQRVIEVPAPPPSEPEIYFVNYDDGENPTLPSGVDLQSALASALEANGQVIAEGLGDSLAGPEGIGGAVDIGNVAVVTSGTGENTFTNSDTGVPVSVSGSQGSQIAVTPSSTSTASFPTLTHAFAESNTGSHQSGGISTGSQISATTAASVNQPVPSEHVRQVNFSFARWSNKVSFATNKKMNLYDPQSSDTNNNLTSYTTLHDRPWGNSGLPSLLLVGKEHFVIPGQSLQSPFSNCDLKFVMQVLYFHMAET
ncbi:uncharacterized protein LOC134770680 [Penaeus indicus]|uniref:uncharacterized protein LOC134770680 n=1 Tax=Penaeus indicus TaxID=29960 RepID=UPI00300BFFF2